MSVATDARGCAISGAHPSALLAYERAIAAFQGWRDGAGEHLEQALQRAPDFVMAHVMQAYLVVCSRDPRLVRSARPILARAGGLRTNECERLHLAAIGAVLTDDYQGARAILGRLLLANLSPSAGELGGSHAQRDVLHLTLLHGIAQLRRPRRGGTARAPAMPAIDQETISVRAGRPRTPRLRLIHRTAAGPAARPAGSSPPLRKPFPD